MSESVAVFGSAGQLGLEVCREFERRGWTVHPFDRTKVDVTGSSKVDAVLDSIKPRLVVNAAAYNQVDLAENDPLAAYQANSLAVRNLAVACRRLGSQLLHYSTDYVFDGKKGSAYVESDATHPIGAYAVSKLAGEQYAQAYVEDALIIRTSGVFGPGGLYTPRSNFVELMLKLANNGQPIRVVDDHVASPTYAPALAARSADLIDKEATGIFHIGGGEPISWHAYAKLIFETAGVTADLHATNEQEYKTAARRPKYSALANARLSEAAVLPMPSLRDALGSYFEARQTATAHR